ncbi:unnamed protein product [Chrysodeixis includens]|uniref:CHK kinase-like domain-containing protein n=1 Tax=Chrysodeixis includens TaxID=689277 RepID=A0A9P0BKZ0_CHRIL|nr:unnamed protein product [Chrysodeixis includens]
MAQHNFEGNIDDINERQLEFIGKVIEELGFKDSKVTIEPVGKAGDNYTANVKRITIEHEEGTKKLVAKFAPSIELLRASFNTKVVFNNEHIMYTEVLPKLLQLQIDADIPESEQLKFAKCHGSLAEEPNEVIVLEDLGESNFVMLDRLEYLSDESVRSILKNFGIYHSLSYVLKKKEPDTYDHYKDSLLEVWASFNENSDMMNHFTQLENLALMVLADPEHQNILRHKVATALTQAVKFNKYDKNNKYAVIQQGDSWTNNFLFKFEEGVLKESVLIDYQLSRSGLPVFDLLYMIFNCTDHETRCKHYYEWLDYYYSELEKSLSHYGLKSNFVYPRDQLDADLKRYGKVAFSVAVIVSSALIMKSEDISKLQENMMNAGLREVSDSLNSSIFDEETVLRFRNRLVGLIDSMKEFGLL